MIDGKAIAAIIEQVRLERPLVHHLTNYVTMGDCAAITACVGALPVMAQAEEEVEEMVASAHAAVINTGTLSPSRVRAMGLMGIKAREKGIPVVLDPVGAGATSYRTGEILALIRNIMPPIIKGNKAEIGFLAGVHGVKIRGIQTISETGDSLETVHQFRENLHYHGVVAMTGPVDIIYDGRRLARVFNGHSLLPMVVGSGCMAASVIAAFAAVEEDHFTATTAALAALGVAAEIAVKTVDNGGRMGPAEFRNRWLDALFLLTAEQLAKGVRIEVDAGCQD
ncbi:MAG: hydroxyethylthiazole kinase [Bacillota bacterium]|nr:hydroxyethylthiazole kinase [Bacillota bacterium]